jgi:hypothetical protein
VDEVVLLLEFGLECQPEVLLSQMVRASSLKRVVAGEKTRDD